MANDPKTAGKATTAMTDDELQDLVASSDTGARNPVGTAGLVIAGVALCWSLFQLYIASPLPFMLSRMTGLQLVFNDTQTRSIHLAFGVFLAFMAFPALSSSPRDRIPLLECSCPLRGVPSLRHTRDGLRACAEQRLPQRLSLLFLRTSATCEQGHSE